MEPTAARRAVRTLPAALAALVLFAAPGARALWARPAAPVAAEPAEIDAHRLLDRVVAIGASATAGFGVLAADRERPELGAFPVPLAATIAGSFRPAAGSVDLGTGFFFLDPSGRGEAAVTKAIEAKPTCIVAIDFLFWFLYGADDGAGGRLAREEDRLAKLERGLALLDRLPADVPLLLGDLPDMREAVGRILSPSQVPSPETLARANARVAAWIAARPQTVRFRLADTTAQLARGESVTVAGVEFCPTPNAPLLQNDRLHPTFRGTVALGLQVAETLAAAYGPPVAERLVRDEATASVQARAAAAEAIRARRATATSAPRSGS